MALDMMVRAAASHPALAQAASVGTGGLSAWIKNNVIGIVILVIGVAILWSAKGGNISKGVTIFAGAMIGIVFLGLATGTTASDIGAWAVHLITKG